MSGFIAVIQNSFWETLDMKTFWIFLILTILSALGFGLITFRSRDNPDQVAREAITNQLKTTLRASQSRMRQGHLGVDVVRDQIRKDGENEFVVPFSLECRLQRGVDPIGINMVPPGIFPHLFTPSEIQSNGAHSGFGNISFSEPQLTLTVPGSDGEDVSETATIPEDVWNRFTDSSHNAQNWRDHPKQFRSLPDELLNRFERERIRSVLGDTGSGTAAEGSTGPNDVLRSKARLTTNIRYTRTHPERVPGDSYFSVRFLAEDVPIGQSRSDFLLVYVLNFVVPYLSGWLGVILGIIITSNFIPDLLREGEIELLLSKQTPRWLIFLGRFIGASLFFGLLTGVFLGLGSIILYLSTGVFTGYMITSFFPLMLIFFMVYSLSALIGLLTQSRILSILGALFGWFTLWLINYVAFLYNRLNETQTQFFGLPEDHWFVNGLLTLDTLLPSGSEINSLSLKFLYDFGFFSDYTIEVLGMGERLSTISPSNILLSSIGFIVFFLGLSFVIFYRKEF